MTNFKEKARLIWDIADLLRGDYKRSDYGKVILPLTVLRRLDAVLAPTKENVLSFLPRVETLSDNAKDLTLNKVAGHNFHNRSQFDFAKIVSDPNNVAMNLRNYINGFSANAREIIEYFNFDDQIDRMDDPKSDILFQTVKSFSEINFDGVSSEDMGYIFEELIRKFAEQSNETAGEHFTPREVIELMVNLLFSNDDEIFQEGIVRTLYDPACGTGGMLSMGEKHLKKLNPDAKLELFGQEINPESYAICKSDMLIKGDNPSNIKFGNTFTVDGLRDEKFDYMLSNPPFGVDWKKASKSIKAEAENLGYAGRFGAGLPRINDGSLLFLQHMIFKMRNEGSRIGIVFNGSPLFTGQAGSGESNIRQWIIENDWLEAIVALPDQLFYNTGISTYIWIVNNNKDRERQEHIQLINATGIKDEELIKEGKRDFNRFWEKMTRSLGNKRKVIPEQDDTRGVNYISKLYGEYQESEFVKILPNEYFGYWRVTVEQPLKDTNGNVIKSGGKPKANPNLRDSENIPFLREDTEGNLIPQTIDEYMKREVLPHVPDAWIDEKKTKIGYEINFTKYFYEFKPLRSLADIRADILALEESSLELEQQVLI